jgi:hypothetical protein
MQQVNLYQPILRKQEKVFSAKTLLQANLLVVVGLGLIYVYTLMQTQGLKQQLEQAAQQRDAQLIRNAELLRQYPPKNKDTTLAARIEAASLALQNKRSLLGSVEELGLDSSVQFSQHLTALARQDIPTLWLRHIHLQYGRQVALQGSALKAEDVPVYLQRLSDEEVFSGTAFQRVVIERSEEFEDRVDFAINTRIPTEDEERGGAASPLSAASAYLPGRAVSGL